MPYANESPTYRIPWMAEGDRSSGISERRSAYIVDKQISGVARLIGNNGIIQDGSYQGVYSAGASSVALLGTAENYAIEGYIEGVYIAQNNTLNWLALPDSSTIYLYVQLTEQNLYTSLEQSSLAYGKVITQWNTTGLTPPNAILLAIVTTTTSAITINSGPNISDTTFAQRPTIQPYGEHRSANPIDHPFHSIFNVHLTDNIIRSNNLHPWDGITSGTGVYSILSGTGIASVHIKPRAVTSEKLDASLSASGLQIQNTFTTLPQSTSTLSGVNLYPGFTGRNLTETVPLQYLQNSLSGVQQGLFNSLSGVRSELLGNDARLMTGLSGLQANVVQNTGDIAGLQANVVSIDNQINAILGGTQASSIAITSGVAAMQVLYPIPFTTEPVLLATVHRVSAGNRVYVTDITSGSSGGFVANFAGGSPNTGTHTLHWQATLPTS